MILLEFAREGVGAENLELAGSLIVLSGRGRRVQTVLAVLAAEDHPVLIAAHLVLRLLRSYSSSPGTG